MIDEVTCAFSSCLGTILYYWTRWFFLFEFSFLSLFVVEVVCFCQFSQNFESSDDLKNSA